MENLPVVVGLLIVSLGSAWTELSSNIDSKLLSSERTGSSGNRVVLFHDVLVSKTNFSSYNTTLLPPTSSQLSTHVNTQSFHFSSPSSNISTSISQSMFSSPSHAPSFSSGAAHSSVAFFSHSVQPSMSHSMNSSSHSIHPFSSQSMHPSSSHSMHSPSHFLDTSSFHSMHPSPSHSLFSSDSSIPISSHSMITSMSELPPWSSGSPLYTSGIPSSSRGVTSEITAISASSHASSNGTSVTVTPSASSSHHAMQTTSHVTATSHVMSSHISIATSSQSPVSSSQVPTMKPTTKPAVKPVVLKLQDSQTKKTCIEVMAEVSFEVNYQANKEKKVVQVPLVSGNVAGNCAKPNHTAASIQVTFSTFYTFMMEFTVEKNNVWKTSNVSFSAGLKNNPAFPNATAESITGYVSAKSSADTAEFKASNRSFKCDKERDIRLTNDISVEFKTLQLQPFTLNNNTFSEPDLCMDENNKNKGNSIVPIAVGCALAGLIIIVLIAYLIGRRRSHRGYQQV